MYFQAHKLSTAIRLLLRLGTEIQAASRPALTLPRKPRATLSTLRVPSGVTILLLLISKTTSRLHIVKASRRLFPAHISGMLITTTRMRLPQMDQTTLLSTAMRNMVMEEMPTTGVASKRAAVANLQKNKIVIPRTLVFFASSYFYFHTTFLILGSLASSCKSNSSLVKFALRSDLAWLATLRIWRLAAFSILWTWSFDTTSFPFFRYHIHEPQSTKRFRHASSYTMVPSLLYFTRFVLPSRIWLGTRCYSMAAR